MKLRPYDRRHHRCLPSGRQRTCAATAIHPAVGYPHRPAGRDEGSTLIELVLLTPVLFLAILLVIQVTLFMHGRQVVTAAAQQGARAERQSAAGGRGVPAALDFADRVAGAAVTGVQADVQRGPESVDVTVTGEGQSIIPWLHLTVTGHSTGPIERFTTDVR